MLRADRTQPFGFIREFATRWDALALIVVIGLVAFLAAASRGLLGAALAARRDAAVARTRASARVRGAHHAAHVRRAGALAGVHPDLCHLGRQEPARRAASWCRCSTSCSRCRSSVSFRSRVVFFMSLVPGRVLGAEFAAIFAIFTSQAWNMAFSFYQSLRTVPTELAEAAASFRLTPWMRFWQLEVPFALPALIWNMMMSMSGRLVLRRRLGIDQRRPHARGAARHRLVHCARHRAAQPARHRLGDRHHADRHPGVRPAAVPAADRLGRPLPRRAGAGRRAARLLGADHDAALAPDQAA